MKENDREKQGTKDISKVKYGQVSFYVFLQGHLVLTEWTLKLSGEKLSREGEFIVT